MMKLKKLGSEGRYTLSLLLCLLLATLGAQAQTITISPQTGNVMAAISTSSENHMAGYGGAWVHNQLPMNMFTADDAELTDIGLPKTHANNIAPKGDKFVWCGGTSKDGFFTISLPKGYRFTGYKMVITNNVSDEDFTESFGTSAYSLTERSGSFEGEEMATVNLGTHNVSSTTQYTLQRTATLANDMGNVLYFRLGHTSGQYAAVYVQSFVISFECDKNFVETVAPTTAISTGVDCVEVPFETDRMDMGSFTWASGGSSSSTTKAWRYNYNNVKDLEANLLLYNDDAVKDGTASTANVGSGNITTASDGKHFALKNDTYYIETPTMAMTQNAGNIPVGYRITGARLHYANTVTGELALGHDFYITDGNGNYMNTSLSFTSTPVLWSSTTAGVIYCGNTYLRVTTSGWLFTTYSLSTTTSSSSASTFVLDGANLYYSTSRTNYYILTTGKIGSSGTKATLVPTQQSDPETNSYTLTLYGTDGTTPAQTVLVNAENTQGEVEVVLLNNDALKFEVSELTGSAAYVYAELTMEALNPYISRTDIVGAVADGSETLSQSYLADDFTIGEEGNVSFHIPDNFASQTIKFSFDNLTNSQADDTYGPLKNDGYSRYHYVKSAYYDTIGESLQDHRTEAANHDYTDKVRVAVAGNQQFKVNNSDEFKIGSSEGSDTKYYTETRYTNADYAEQGGQWAEVSLGKDDEAKDCYLVTCDETRYNLAPTTTPRHAFYAYYSTTIQLDVQDYEPALTYVKVYDSAMLQSGLDQNAYYGVKAGAVMKGSATPVEAGTGYLFTKQIQDQIEADAGKTGYPKDAKHVLYIDASDLNAVLYGITEANKAKYGTIEQLQAAVGDNAMLYLPVGTTYTLNNLASRTAAGDFLARNNIVLKDKQPFFAPADIRVDANNFTQYTREVTHTYGKSNYITLVVPFTIDIQDGKHTNAQGGSAFSFYNMQLTNAISDVTGEENYDYEVTGHFAKVSGLTTESNNPYLVSIENFEEDAQDNVLFVVRQNGANIVKTPTDASGTGTLIDGESASGKIGTSSVTFTQHGTLNGVKRLGTTGTYFYFAKNRFVSSANLMTSDKAVYVMPFRTYYDYTGSSNAKMMNISLEFNSEPTDIRLAPAETSEADIFVSSSAGMLTVTAVRDAHVTITSLGGQTVATADLPSGMSHTVALPTGLYLANGQKVIVK